MQYSHFWGPIILLLSIVQLSYASIPSVHEDQVQLEPSTLNSLSTLTTSWANWHKDISIDENIRVYLLFPLWFNRPTFPQQTDITCSWSFGNDDNLVPLQTKWSDSTVTSERSWLELIPTRPQSLKFGTIAHIRCEHILTPASVPSSSYYLIPIKPTILPMDPHQMSVPPAGIVTDTPPRIGIPTEEQQVQLNQAKLEPTLVLPVGNDFEILMKSLDPNEPSTLIQRILRLNQPLLDHNEKQKP